MSLLQLTRQVDKNIQDDKYLIKRIEQVAGKSVTGHQQLRLCWFAIRQILVSNLGELVLPPKPVR